MGQKKTTAKVFKNGQESPSDATLNEPVPRLIRMLACDCQKKKYFVPNQSFKASIYRAGFVIFLYERVRLPENSTAFRTCLAGAGELSSGTVFSFSMKMSPQSLLYQFHSILLHHLSKKNFSYTCLTSMPSRRFCVNKPSSTQAEFFNWTFFFFFCWHVILGVRFPYNPNIYYACMF